MDYITIPDEIIKERDEICTPLKLGEKVSLTKAKNDLTYFCWHQLGIKPYAWQHLIFKHIMNNQEDILACTPRQVGKSFVVAVASLHHVIYNILPVKSKGDRTMIGIVSKTEGQNKKLIQDIRTLMDIGDAHVYLKYNIKKWFSSHLSTRQTDTNNKTQLTFRALETKKVNRRTVMLPDGKVIGQIIAVPPTDSARGYTFSKLFMDEAAFFEDEGFFSTTAEPTLRSTNGKSVVTTTPNGQKGWFYKVFDPDDEHEDNPYFRIWLHYSHIEDDEEREAVLNKKHKMELSGEAKKFEQEYEAKFTVDCKSFFDLERVEEIIDPELAQFDSFDKPCDLGLDVGYKSSRTVISITRLGDDKVARRIWHYVYPKSDDLPVVQDIIALIPRFNVQRVIIDECPASTSIVQELVKKGVNVKLMNFKTHKTSKFIQFRAKLYKGQIKTYKDKALLAEMRNMEEVEGMRNTRIEKTRSGSDDILDSFIISCFFYLDETKTFKIYDWDDY